jgi:hypothetical protein
LLNLTLGLQIVQWLVTNVDNGFLSHQIVIPLLNNLNQYEKFLIVRRVVQDSNFIMISIDLTSYIKNTPIDYPLASISTLKYFYKLGNVRIGA